MKWQWVNNERISLSKNVSNQIYFTYFYILLFLTYFQMFFLLLLFFVCLQFLMKHPRFKPWNPPRQHPCWCSGRYANASPPRSSELLTPIKFIWWPDNKPAPAWEEYQHVAGYLQWNYSPVLFNDLIFVNRLPEQPAVHRLVFLVRVCIN